MASSPTPAFVREERYIVIKKSHLHCADANISAASEQTLRDFLDAQEIIPVEAVVVEADWLEYETVWAMIEARVIDAPLPKQDRAVERAVELMGEALFNFSGRMRMAGVFASGSELTDTNAASYERVVGAWSKLTGAIARRPLPAWDHYAEEHVTSNMVPRDVAESWRAKAENYSQEREDFLADFSDMMALHVENWPAPKKLKTVIALVEKTLRAMVPKPDEAENRTLLATNAALVKALREAFQTLTIIAATSDDADTIAAANETAAGIDAALLASVQP